MGCSASVAVVAKSAPEFKVEAPYEEGSQKDFWKCMPDDEADIVFAKTGMASREKVPPSTILGMFRKSAEKHANQVHMKVERGLPDFVKGQPAPPPLPWNQWTQWTYSESLATVERVGKAMRSLGARQHDAVVIYGFNSPEWAFSSLGAMCSGLKSTGIYPTDTEEQIVYKTTHSGAAIVCCEFTKQVEIFKTNADALPGLLAIVTWDKTCKEEQTLTRTDGSTLRVLPWSAFEQLGENVEKATWDAWTAEVRPGHCAALVYTSGTTGPPKAVMVTHDNLVFESCTVGHQMSKMGVGDLKLPDRLVSYLPLSHVAGMLIDIIFPALAPSFFSGYATVGFARPYDLKTGALKERLCTIRPTFFLGVPRVWEKFQEALMAVGAQTKGIKKKVSAWAKKKNLEYQKGRNMGGSGVQPAFLGLSRKVMMAVKGKLGLDKMKIALTGAAPIALGTLEYFGQIDININEVFGMSETTGGHVLSSEATHMWGSAGHTVEGVETLTAIIDPDDLSKKTICPRAKDVLNPTEEEQGEIIMRGRNIMMGYMAQPSMGPEHVEKIKEANRKALDSEGWMHSGDKGCIGENGMVKITGRYKEIIIGAGGENIAPVPIEDDFKKIATALSNVVMIGNHRKFNIALLTLKCAGATGELAGTTTLAGPAKDVDANAVSIEDACKNEGWKSYLLSALEKVNQNVPNNTAKIQKFTILPLDLSVETGDLTPTLKLKRSVVEKKHAEMIEKVYASSEVFVPYEA